VCYLLSQDVPRQTSPNQEATAAVGGGHSARVSAPPQTPRTAAQGETEAK